MQHIGHNMKHALAFATKYPGWHGYAKDRATLEAIVRLEKRGIVETKWHCFRLSKT